MSDAASYDGLTGAFDVRPAPWASLLAVAAVVVGLMNPATANDPFEWQTATPESQGMSSARLDALRDELAKRKTKAFLVVRNDRIVYEWYAPDHGRNKPHGTASLAKALVAGLSLGIAVTDGTIALDDRAARFVRQWEDDP